QLLVIAGPDKGQVFPLADTGLVTIGRGREAQVRLSDLAVSRLHCRVEVRDGGVVLSDAGSAGGTLLNGRPVTEHLLPLNDTIQVGTTQLRLQDAADTADQPTLTPLPRAAVPPAGDTPQQLGELIGQTLAHYEVGPVRARGTSGLVFRGRDLENDE